MKKSVEMKVQFPSLLSQIDQGLVDNNNNRANMSHPYVRHATLLTLLCDPVRGLCCSPICLPLVLSLITLFVGSCRKLKPPPSSFLYPLLSLPPNSTHTTVYQNTCPGRGHQIPSNRYLLTFKMCNPPDLHWVTIVKNTLPL